MPALAILDPQEARPLTSREIAKLFCGVIGSLATHDDPPSRDALQRVLEHAKSSTVDLAALDFIALHGNDAETCTWGAALGATAISLRGWCRAHDVSTAISWVVANLDAIWLGERADVTPIN